MTYTEQTRQHFVDIAVTCMAQAIDGTLYVNNLGKYLQQQLQYIDDMYAGKNDHTFTFLQRKEWLETGVMRPLLPK